MFTEMWWSWWIRSAVLSTLVLLAASLAYAWMRQPAARLRLIQWAMAACLIAPWLPVSTVWRTVSVDLVGWLQSESKEAPGSISVPSSIPPESLQNRDASPYPGETPSGTSPEQQSEFAATPSETVREAARLPRPEALPIPPTSLPITLPGVLVAVWALTTLTMLLWLVAGLWLRLMLQRRAHAASTALRQIFDDIAGPEGKRVRLIVSDAIESPMTWGTLRPIIAVPKRFENSQTAAELRWGLAHEWSHVKQRDIAWLSLAVAVQFVCFYQPLYWILRRWMILCQDHIADAFAKGQSESPEDYAAFLIGLAKARMHRAALALGIVDARSQLFQRVKMLVDPRADIRPNCTRRTAFAAACGSLVFLFLSTTIRLDAASESPEPKTASDVGTPAKNNASDSNAVSAPTNGTARNVDRIEAGVVSGVLTDARGKPVAGARVLLRSGGLVTTESDDQGRFRFEKIPPYKLGYELLAYHENLITGVILVRQLPTDDASIIKFEPLRLVMKPGKQAHFAVRSKETGQPIPRATVRFGYPDRRNVSTGDDGAATVGGLIPQPYEVTVEADGYARYPLRIDLTQSAMAAEYAAELIPGGTVDGLVLDEQGQPVPEAEVVYREPNLAGYHGDAFRTDSAGKFRHRFLPLNVSLEVSIRKDGYISQAENLSLSSRQPSRHVRITLPRKPPGGSVTGVIRNQNGNPLAGVLLANDGRGSSQERSTTTNEQGRFVLHDLLEGYQGGVEIRISAKGFAPQRLPITPGTRASPAEVDVSLEPGHTLRGIVVNQVGKPVTGAYVMARSPVFRHGLESVRTDEQGGFALDSLPGDVRFQVSHPQYASTDNKLLKLDDREPKKIVLDDPGMLRGQVFDAKTKQPLRHFRIRLGSSRLRQPGDARGSYLGSWGNPGLTFRGADGRFTIEPLTAGMPLELTIEADGYERHVLSRAVADIADSVEDLSIPLSPKTVEDRSTLKVQFRDYRGKPIPNVHLRLIVSADQPAGRDDNAFNWALIDSGQLATKSYVEQFLAAVTNAEGEFEFQDVLPGRFVQLAYWGEGVPKGRTLVVEKTRPAQTDEVDIDVPQPITVKGSVDRAAYPDAGAIRASSIEESFLTFQVELADDQSEFELRDLPPGSYWISLQTKPSRFTENGIEMRRTSRLAAGRFVLKPGDVKEIAFEGNR